MIFNDTLFLALTFFTLGFLCLIGLISFVLNYYFKSKAYGYYLTYITLTILFFITIILKQEKIGETDSNHKLIIAIAYDFLRTVAFFFHSLFIFKSMVLENNAFKKLNWLMYFYSLIVFFRIAISILNPVFMDNNPVLLSASRTLVFSICFVVYYFLFKNISNHYLRFLFIASTILILSFLLSIGINSLNNNRNTILGFLFLCVGIILENICFVSAFIFQIIIIDRSRKNAEITHKEQLSTVQLEMQQQTMQHIGREIHDNVGQKLTLASLYTQQLAFENKAPLIKNTIENISDIINQSLNDLRQLSKSLTDNTIKINTLYNLLALECEKCNEIKNCEMNLESNSKNMILPYQTKSVLLRISQEFIQNSIKHSGCKNINITLNKVSNKLQLCLQDDGKGFDVNKINSGIGLKNIKKRIEIIGGSYILESQEKTGTKLLIDIPL